MLKKCPKCGTVYQDDVKFCINCGMKLTYEVPAHTNYEESSNTWKWAAAIIAVVIIGGGAFWFFNTMQQNASAESTTEVADSEQDISDAADANYTEAQEHEEEEGDADVVAPEESTQSQLVSKQAETISNGEWWTGSIGEYGIRMYINENADEFWYHYTWNSSDNRLYLTVVENSGDHLVLLETNKNGNNTGKFDGYINGDTYSGTFYNLYNGKTFGFTLTKQ